MVYMEKDIWLSDTRRVCVTGANTFNIHIKQDIAKALELKQGSLIEFRIRNTGKILEVFKRREKKGVNVVKEEVFTGD